MRRIIVVYGSIAGAVVVASILAGLALTRGERALHALEWLGYLVMLVALSLIFLGIKRYRDRELGGVIRFGTALLVGLGIAAVASAIYVVTWEIYLAATDYAFIDVYTRGILEAKRAEGLGAAELEALAQQMETMKRQYSNPLFRLPITFLEIFPVGLLISLVSAAILRNSRVLPETR